MPSQILPYQAPKIGTHILPYLPINGNVGSYGLYQFAGNVTERFVA